MATKCASCGKKPTMANKRKLLRGHYNIVNRYRKYPNLQWSNSDGQRVKICTSCIKAQSKPDRLLVRKNNLDIKMKKRLANQKTA